MLRPVLHCLSALLACALAFAPGPVAAQPAIQPGNRPTPLAGVENGEVPGERLITVAPGCRVAREAGPSLALLFRSARADGLPLFGRDCYRPLSGQVAVQRSWTSRGNSACAATPQVRPDGRPRGTSMHGWGKAVDVGAGSPMTFSSPGYRWLKANAGELGWNHPGWAEPGGGPCPEPWHWEWVGDGGTEQGIPVRADVVAVLPAADDRGHAVVTGLGDVQPAGTARSHGDAVDLPLSWVVVGGAPAPDGAGYWLVAGDGGVFGFGSAGFHGSTGGVRLNAPVVGMAATPDGRGYWLVAADGGVFSFGSARFHGSTGAIPLREPVVGAEAAPDGDGYWLVAEDGGVFSFGSATFRGSAAERPLATPVVDLAPTRGGDGYRIVTADGTVIPFGGAR